MAIAGIAKKAFDGLNSMLVGAPVLQMPEFSRSFVIETDAL